MSPVEVVAVPKDRLNPFGYVRARVNQARAEVFVVAAVDNWASRHAKARWLGVHAAKIMDGLEFLEAGRIAVANFVPVFLPKVEQLTSKIWFERRPYGERAAGPPGIHFSHVVPRSLGNASRAQFT